MPVLTPKNTKNSYLHAAELPANESCDTTAVDQPMGTAMPRPESEETQAKEQSLGEFLRASPLYGLDLDFTRDKSLPREISLD